jgi:serine/threonine protein phosphatase PrpC
VTSNYKIDFFKPAPDYSVFTVNIPFKRNQDIVKIKGVKNKKNKNGLKFTASVVDGWNNLKKIPSHIPGWQMAKFTAEKFPQVFLKQKGSLRQKAVKTAKFIDKLVLKKWPKHVGCTGAFLFAFKNKYFLTSVGSISVFVFKNKAWQKASEIKNYYLDPEKYKTDTARFFGRGELKPNSLFSAKPNFLKLDSKTPVLIATDGFDDLFTDNDLNKLIATANLSKAYTKKFFKKLINKIKQNSQKQKDDIAMLLVFKK